MNIRQAFAVTCADKFRKRLSRELVDELHDIVEVLEFLPLSLTLGADALR